MPFESEDQERFFRLCLESPDKADKPCPPRRVILEFINAQKKARRKELGGE
jgi:hypothetical protein